MSCTATISDLSDKDAVKHYSVSPVNAKTTISSILVYLLGEYEKPTQILRRGFGPDDRNLSPGPPEYDRMLERECDVPFVKKSMASYLGIMLISICVSQL